MKTNKSTTRQILKNIDGNGGFCNLNHWNEKEIAQWVKCAYYCSYYVAKKVAFYLAK